MNQDMTKFFPACISFIEESLQTGGKCLIHCIAGVSRSATIACLFLSCTLKITPETALQMLQRVRPIACPNANFMKQLTYYFSGK